MAKWREFDEVFRILDAECVPQLCAAVMKKGLRCERGARFWHCFGGSDKASAVHVLRKLFKRVHGLTVTIGLGDTCMDSEFLNAVIVPVVVRSEESDQLKATVPDGEVWSGRLERGTPQINSRLTSPTPGQ